MRRALAVAAAAAVALAAVLGLLLALNARDDAGVASDARSGPGALQPDNGHRHLAAGQHAPAGLGDPPASGPHAPDLVPRDRRPITDDQLIHAAELGDVVLLYDAPRPPAALVRLQQDVAGPFDPELAAAGQAVVLARRADAGPATAVAWRRVLRTADPADPRLRRFADAWLGQGAPGD
jgi:hypothetical protein